MSDNELIFSNNQELSLELQDEIEEARKLLQESKAENTRLAYEKDWKQFSAWCQAKGFPALPTDPAVIVLYVNHMYKEGKKVSTIQRHLTSISQKHEQQQYNSPTKDIHVRDAVKAVARKIGTKPKQKQAATVGIIKAICDQLPNDLRGMRDRAILLVGMAGALRRSEIAALNVEDIEFHEEGMTIFISQSKTDQKGEGELIGIELGVYPYCPVRALQQWLRKAKIKDGAVFRRIDKTGRVRTRLTDKSIAMIVKKSAELAGFDETEFSGHSLRRGFITSAKRLGMDEHDIMKHTRHKSIQTMRRYIDKSDVFQKNPTKGLWK